MRSDTQGRAAGFFSRKMTVPPNRVTRSRLDTYSIFSNDECGQRDGEGGAQGNDWVEMFSFSSNVSM